MYKWKIMSNAIYILLAIALNSYCSYSQKPIGKIKNDKVKTQIDYEGVENLLLKKGYHSLKQIKLHYNNGDDFAILHITAKKKDQKLEIIRVKLHVEFDRLWFPKPSTSIDNNIEWFLVHSCDGTSVDEFKGISEISCNCTETKPSDVPCSHTISTSSLITFQQLYHAI